MQTKAIPQPKYQPYINDPETHSIAENTGEGSSRPAYHPSQDVPFQKNTFQENE
jgi:hypothetical protein